MTEADKEKMFFAMEAYIASLPKPTPAKASPEFRDWWVKTLPVLKDQCLSELHRLNSVSPKMILFRVGAKGMAIIDLGKELPNWGDQESKDRTAYVHQLGALIPSVYASVLVTEAWTLTPRNPQVDGDEIRRAQKEGLANHPERGEAIVMQVLHKEGDRMMQLTTMIEVLKVLGKNVSPENWASTKYGTERIIDIFGDPDHGKFQGRFVYGDTGKGEADGNT